MAGAQPVLSDGQQHDDAVRGALAAEAVGDQPAWLMMTGGNR